MQTDLFPITEKEAWQMTQPEFLRKQGHKGEFIPTFTQAARGISAHFKGQWSGQKHRNTIAWHRNIVAVALKEGRDVPKEVLAYYPEIEG
ncbi:MAG: hypothetical protein NUV49_04290 [Patescibacteria group bacterium]|nr:hypothetical protein [Patescibacteria group bacterium]